MTCFFHNWPLHRGRLSLLLAGLLALILFMPTVTKPLAANGNLLFFSISGSLVPDEAINPIIPIFQTERDFNFSLTTVGSGPVSLTITNSQGDPVWAGVVNEGETLWGTGALTNGHNPLSIQNLGGATASFALRFYDLPTAPYPWSGTAASVGLQSVIRANFPTPGLYTFDLGVAAGQYQFLLNENYIRKTAVSDTSVTYFVPAGTHTLTLLQSDNSGASWQVDISAPGNAADPFPYQKTGVGLLGSSERFNTEWLPVYLIQPTALNLAVTVTGSVGEAVSLDVMQPGNRQPKSLLPTIYTGETVWATLDLPAGINLIKLEADGVNSDPVQYELVLDNLAMPDYLWSGSANPAGSLSESRVIFDAAGLYTFTFSLGNGRYQFQLDDVYLQKTIETDSSVTVYVPAGTHQMRIIQDDLLGAEWEILIASATTSPDNLPFTQSGGGLGSSTTPFITDILPLYTGMSAEANLSISIGGEANDSMLVTLVDLVTGVELLSLDAIYGGETLWATLLLPENGVSVRLEALGTNASPLSYAFTIENVPQITGNNQNQAVWDGQSSAVGINPEFRVETAISGLYLVEVDMPQEGFIAFSVNAGRKTLGAFGSAGFFYDFEVPLEAGFHVFEGQQNNALLTTWTLTTTLLLADPPQIMAISPASLPVGSAHMVSLAGKNFMPGATISLKQGGTTIPLTNVEIRDATLAIVVIPASVEAGEYDVVLTNPDNQTAAFANGINVFQPIYYLYLPIVQNP